jgi:acetoacetate decarboxylase
MGYVKTPEEVERIQERLADVKYVGESLMIEFETTPEFVRDVLPPCLSPIDTPTGVAAVAQHQSVHVGEHGAAVVYLYAQYEGLVGLYALTLLISTETNQLHGRERWGMAKKVLDSCGLYRDSTDDRETMFGYAARHGTRLIEIEAELSADDGPREGVHHLFELKGFLSPYGVGLDRDPELIIIDVHESNGSVREGTGRLVLQGTADDPCDTIPIVSVGPASHIVGALEYQTSRVITLSDADAYVPYVYGTRYDDFSASRLPARYVTENAFAPPR